MRGSQQLRRKFRDQGPCGVGAGLPDGLSDTWGHPGPRSLQRGLWPLGCAIDSTFQFAPEKQLQKNKASSHSTQLF